MKGLMKTMLAGAIFSAMMAGASAQDAMPGQASIEVNMKIMQEVMAEVPQDKMTDAGFVVDKTIAKMKENIPALREAGVKDCVAIHGDAKTDACKCAADKTDYDALFALMKKQAANPEDVNLSEETRKLSDETEANTIACGFSKAEIDAANEKIMEMMQGSAPKQ